MLHSTFEGWFKFRTFVYALEWTPFKEINESKTYIVRSSINTPLSYPCMHV